MPDVQKTSINHARWFAWRTNVVILLGDLQYFVRNCPNCEMTNRADCPLCAALAVVADALERLLAKHQRPERT